MLVLGVLWVQLWLLGIMQGLSGGRREGSTIAAGCSIGMSGGRPVGTIAAAGYNVGISGYQVAIQRGQL